MVEKLSYFQVDTNIRLSESSQNKPRTLLDMLKETGDEKLLNSRAPDERNYAESLFTARKARSQGNIAHLDEFVRNERFREIALKLMKSEDGQKLLNVIHGAFPIVSGA